LNEFATEVFGEERLDQRFLECHHLASRLDTADTADTSDRITPSSCDKPSILVTPPPVLNGSSKPSGKTLKPKFIDKPELVKDSAKDLIPVSSPFSNHANPPTDIAKVFQNNQIFPKNTYQQRQLPMICDEYQGIPIWLCSM
jgi:hypothetical protein